MSIVSIVRFFWHCNHRSSFKWVKWPKRVGRHLSMLCSSMIYTVHKGQMLSNNSLVRTAVTLVSESRAGKNTFEELWSIEVVLFSPLSSHCDGSATINRSFQQMTICNTFVAKK